jgi:hypothetical protein
MEFSSASLAAELGMPIDNQPEGDTPAEHVRGDAGCARMAGCSSCGRIQMPKIPLAGVISLSVGVALAADTCADQAAAKKLARAAKTSFTKTT